MATSKKKKSAPKRVKKPVKKATKQKAKSAVKKSAKKSTAVKSNKVAKKTPKKSTSKSNAKVQSSKIVKSTFAKNFKPLNDHLLVRQDGESDRTPGGLYIPAIAQDKPAKGTVLAIGTGIRNKKGKIKPLDVQVGEQIVYSPHGGSKVTIEGEDFVILREEEVLGVLKD